MTRIALLIVMLSVMTSAFSADDMTTMKDKQFNSLDTNDNGYISQAEAKDKHRVYYYYQRADKNSDGHLDASEFSAFEVEIPDYPGSVGN